MLLGEESNQFLMYIVNQEDKPTIRVTRLNVNKYKCFHQKEEIARPDRKCSASHPFALTREEIKAGHYDAVRVLEVRARSHACPSRAA